ncbi:hypothetical protein RBB78_11835 [Tunturiibacter empetritectus]|uniref:hypothetical protein n=1 Tax=Tunturiibacter empetritectus TaxID=3069691 RepID=UPI003D9B6AF4
MPGTPGVKEWYAASTAKAPAAATAPAAAPAAAAKTAPVAAPAAAAATAPAAAAGVGRRESCLPHRRLLLVRRLLVAVLDWCG